MARKPKIQGVVSPEHKALWDEWKAKHGIESDGVALTKLLNSHFGDNGDNDDISSGDNKGDNRYNELTQKLESVEAKLSEIDALKEELEAVKKAIGDRKGGGELPPLEEAKEKWAYFARTNKISMRKLEPMLSWTFGEEVRLR